MKAMTKKMPWPKRKNRQGSFVSLRMTINLEIGNWDLEIKKFSNKFFVYARQIYGHMGFAHFHE